MCEIYGTFQVNKRLDIHLPNPKIKFIISVPLVATIKKCKLLYLINYVYNIGCRFYSPQIFEEVGILSQPGLLKSYLVKKEEWKYSEEP